MKKNFFNQDRIGFMQGRLVDKIKKKIQYFPDDNWYEEIKIAKLEKFNLMEWTINYENIKKNPLFNGKIKKLSEIISNNEFQIKSVTCDFFMQKPFFKEKLNYKKKQYLKDISNVIKKFGNHNANNNRRFIVNCNSCRCNSGNNFNRSDISRSLSSRRRANKAIIVKP